MVVPDVMRVLLRGVRGSTPVSGAEHLEVGGSTSCIGVPARDGRWLVLDAGTGFARLGTELGHRPLRGSILLTHLHWDHTQGLPFLPNADRPDAEVDLWLPSQAADPGESPAMVLARAMSPPHFPIRPEQLDGRWRFRAMCDGRHDIEGFVVTAAEVHHKGGRTLGYRVERGGGALAYVPDHSPRLASSARRAAALALVDGVDVLLHGAGYLPTERRLADAYGHATVDDAVELAKAGGVGRLVIIHHSPARTDAGMRDVEASLASVPGLTAVVGREGDWVEIA